MARCCVANATPCVVAGWLLQACAERIPVLENLSPVLSFGLVGLATESVEETVHGGDAQQNDDHTGDGCPLAVVPTKMAAKMIARGG